VDRQTYLLSGGFGSLLILGRAFFFFFLALVVLLRNTSVQGTASSCVATVKSLIVAE
jgi:hypothetical protein